MTVSFDLFDTLVTVERPGDPGDAVAAALRDRGVSVPDDWGTAFRESHRELQRGREYSLIEHVDDALASRDVRVDHDAVSAAVCEAFDPTTVRTRNGASEAVAAAADYGPVGVLSNCSVPGLVERTLDRSDLHAEDFDAVVASVDCGWRKPFDGAFECVADRLGVSPAALHHVGDDPRTDGGLRTLGGTPVLLSDVPLADLPSYFEEALVCR
ncbi:MAG: HAD family hydrolase [Haloarculaceae archaeon]